MIEKEFCLKRNVDTLIEATNHVMQNYNKIQEDIQKKISFL